MPSIDFDVYCAECGEGLCNLTTVENRNWGTRIIVGPCPKCIENAQEQGYETGYEKGQEEKEAV